MLLKPISPYRSPSSRFIRCRNLARKPSTRLHLFDHFIDCAAYPDIAALYGGPSSSMCLGGQSGLSYLLSGGFSQLVTFAFLLVSYYAFKRGVNFLEINGDEWSDPYENEAEDRAFKSQVDRRGKVEASGEEVEVIACPKCNGSGVFTWSREGLTECDLCAGKGSFSMSPQVRNSAPPQLPEAVERQSVWADGDDEE